MNLLSELDTIISSLEIPVESGVFSEEAPDTYAVLIPLNDVFESYADNRPGYDNQGVRISLYSKNNYIKLKNRVIKALINADITITQRVNLGFENDTKYYHYSIDIEKIYEFEMEES